MTMAMINNKWFKVIKEFKSWGPSGYRARLLLEGGFSVPANTAQKIITVGV